MYLKIKRKRYKKKKKKYIYRKKIEINKVESDLKIRKKC